jgi:hypothetical protein
MLKGVAKEDTLTGAEGGGELMARSGRKVGIADTPEVLMVGVGGSGVKESKVG